MITLTAIPDGKNRVAPKPVRAGEDRSGATEDHHSAAQCARLGAEHRPVSDEPGGHQWQPTRDIDPNVVVTLGEGDSRDVGNDEGVVPDIP
jgi:hypothetical protein